MNDIIIKLILAAALLELGITFKDIDECTSHKCLGRLEQASKKVLRIDWKPISIFPEEAGRFREQVKRR